jgi:hypothetical protein
MAPKRKEKEDKKYEFPTSFLNASKAFVQLFYKPEPEAIVDDQIVVIPNFFSKDLCQELINSFTTNITLETTPVRKSREYAVRCNDRFATVDFYSSQKLWEYLKLVLLQPNEYQNEDLAKLQANFDDAIGLNPQLRIYRYTKGHHFGQHYDESVICPLDSKSTTKGKTGWTLLIYLTGDNEFVGGGTIFYTDERGSEPLNIHPSKGMALLHKHGDDCLRHEGELVKSGVKWILRSDLVYPL